MGCGVYIYTLLATVPHISLAQGPAGALIVPPSGQWQVTRRYSESRFYMLTPLRDGVDGPWSTFNFGLGEPLQPFRCVPGIGYPVVILPDQTNACPGGNGNASGACRQRTIFVSSSSSSWKSVGLYGLPESVTFEPIFQNLTGATWGLDNVYLGHNTIRDLRLSQQYVALTNSTELFVGVFGLSAGMISPDGAPRATLLSALYGARVIPSTSFSYTAGSAKSMVLSTVICTIS